MSKDKKDSKISGPRGVSSGNSRTERGSKTKMKDDASVDSKSGRSSGARADGFNARFTGGARAGDKAPPNARVAEKTFSKPNRSQRRAEVAIQEKVTKDDTLVGRSNSGAFPAKRQPGGRSPSKDADRASTEVDQLLMHADDAIVSTTKSDEKLQKVLARVGLGSRREMEREITSGNVTVNGVKATLGDRVSDKDYIEFQGKRVKVIEKEEQRLRVILYNKPEGQICSRSDPEGRPSVYEGLPRLNDGRWISVGRLDFNTSGLLLFTNEGELANKLMHPSSNIDREYLVRIHGDVDDDMLDRLRAGVELDDGVAQFSDIKNGAEEGSNRWFYCVVMEGKNREVRRLWESQGVRVSRLKRVRYGNIFIPSHVRVGQWVELNDREISDLVLTAGMSAPKKPRFSPKIEQTRERHNRKLRAAAGVSKPNPRPKKTPRKPV